LWKIDINTRIIEYRLREWNIQVYTQIADTPFLYIQITILYYLEDTDKEMLKDLEDCGYIALITGVVRIYKKLGLIRYMTIIDRQAADKQLFTILQSELNNRRVTGYGRRYLYIYFR
jgi:hypothetical protein